MELTIRELREKLNLNQHEMAHRMGVPFRTYQDIETGVSAARPIHQRAAERAAFALAAELGDLTLLPKSMRKDFDKLTKAAKG